GSDVAEPGGLAGLVERLTGLAGDFRIRLGSVEPWEVNEDLIALVTGNDKVCPHLHVPLQHTEDRILKMMRRPPIGETMELLRSMKSVKPEMALGVDVIAGFPGETADEFNRLADKIEGLPITYLHPFGFSARPGTPAAKMPDRTAHDIVRARVSRLTGIGERKRAEFAEMQSGRILRVIPDRPRPDRNWTTAVSDNYIKLRMNVHGVQAGCLQWVKMKQDPIAGPVGIRI
ncbi:MAG TPA: radical SAM protein, partial [Bacteroidetes bacterium]|nr:radical SAM protein [Bacteroidota bacterium]